VAGIDFEAEGLLEGLEGEGRKARLRLLEDLAANGVPLEELRQAVDEDRLVLLPVERVFHSGEERCSLEQVAEQSGLEHDFLIRLLQALGAPTPDEGAPLYGSDDVEAAKRAKLFLDAGLPESALLETSRIIGISMANLATANRDMVGDVFTEPGIDERELAQRYAAAAQTMAPLLGETLLHAYRIHLREAISQAVITEAEIAAGRPGIEEVTIAFADLVGFTRLGEQMEIDAIGEMTDRLFELASDAARPPVRLVKMIGDAAMFASREPGPVLDSVLELVDGAGAKELPPLRAGVAAGPALSRGGDWYGRPVNLAARITDFARPESVVVSQGVKDALGDDANGPYSLSFAGKRKFKGINDEVAVHRLRRAEHP